MNYCEIETHMHFHFFLPMQTEDWDVKDKTPENMIQVLNLFQALLKVFSLINAVLWSPVHHLSALPTTPLSDKMNFKKQECNV